MFCSDGSLGGAKDQVGCRRRAPEIFAQIMIPVSMPGSKQTPSHVYGQEHATEAAVSADETQTKRRI